MTRPDPIRLYHITHVDNLSGIVSEDGLLSDQLMIDEGGPAVSVGMSTIKQRRLNLPVSCHAGEYVGQYVPFYFCPRSIMLSMFWYDNRPEITYHGGQEPIVHLVYDMEAAVDWADSTGAKWAFTLSNAGAAYAEFRDDLDDLDDVNWAAVRTNSFGTATAKEGKQAEFLVEAFVPWHLVEKIGVHNANVRGLVENAISAAAHQPPVAVERYWYF